MTPEKRVQNKMIAYLTKLVDANLPVMYERRQAGGFSYKKGLPDIYCVYDGQHIEIEVKKPGGERTPAQEKWEAHFRKIGIKYICADNVDDIKYFFEHEYGVKV